MFEKLFTYPAVIRRHREGPLAAERAAYLNDLASRGMARGTLLIRSSYCLCVAIEIGGRQTTALRGTRLGIFRQFGPKGE